MVQSGWLKRAVFRTIVHNHCASGAQIDGSYDEVRRVVNTPVQLF